MLHLSSRALTPVEERRKAYYAAQGKEVEVRRMAEEDSDEDEKRANDYFAYQASRFRESWEVQWFGYFGFFEDTTKIPCMSFTDRKPEEDDDAYLCSSLQIFSLKVAGIKDGLQWPLHVFGTVFLRDSVDHNRNPIFDRTRDNCQILIQEVPYLTLTDPIRAVVIVDPVTFEVDLKVKGTTEAEDKHLSSLAVPFTSSATFPSRSLKRDYTSKLSTLEFALGLLDYSLEATITVRVTHGSWPDGYRAQIAARTASISHEKIILLDSRDKEAVLVDDDGWIPLSRQVASVEINGKLKVGVKALLGDDIDVTKERFFSPKKAGKRCGTLNVGFCRMDVTVAWSLTTFIPFYKHFYKSVGMLIKRNRGSI